jgi:hypothetical protein
MMMILAGKEGDIARLMITQYVEVQTVHVSVSFFADRLIQNCRETR